MKKFDKGFLLGAATAAHQVEGNNANSDFWAMEQVPGSIFKDDFIGVQNYSRKLVDSKNTLPPPDGAELTQMGYEYYPEAIGNNEKAGYGHPYHRSCSTGRYGSVRHIAVCFVDNSIIYG